jgi:hypothetical protein
VRHVGAPPEAADEEGEGDVERGHDPTAESKGEITRIVSERREKETRKKETRQKETSVRRRRRRRGWG